MLPEAKTDQMRLRLDLLCRQIVSALYQVERDEGNAEECLKKVHERIDIMFYPFSDERNPIHKMFGEKDE